MNLFSNYAIIALLQLACIVASFFTPELLYRMTGRERRWHVPAASSLLIVSVLLLTWLHGTATTPEATATPQQSRRVEARETATRTELSRESQTDFSVTTRFGTVPVAMGRNAPVSLSIANNGAQAEFACELAVLDGDGLKPAPQDAFQVEPVTVTAQAAPGETAQCSWKVLPRIIGAYVLQVSAAAEGNTASQQVRVKVEHDYRVDVQEEVWVFNSRTQANAEKLSQQLRDAGFHNAVAKGEWKTRSEEQYIFYRDADKMNLDELFVEIGIPDVQPYHYDSPRVGGKVKEMFDQDPELGFLVIIH